MKFNFVVQLHVLGITTAKKVTLMRKLVFSHFLIDTNAVSIFSLWYSLYENVESKSRYIWFVPYSKKGLLSVQILYIYIYNADVVVQHVNMRSHLIVNEATMFFKGREEDLKIKLTGQLTHVPNFNGLDLGYSILSNASAEE